MTDHTMPPVIRHPAVRYHGGKFRLASWIISHFPAHRCYVEPFGGGASVLLKKEPSEAEVYNDLDGDVVNLFRVLRHPETSRALSEACALTPYSRDEFLQAYALADNPVEQARRLVVRATMGFGSAGATKGKTGFRLDTKRNCATAQRIWARYPDNLAAVGSRFAGVLVENRDAIQCMRDHDTPSTLHFVDPPYVPDTRVDVDKNRTYRFEMTCDEHAELLRVLNTLQGMVVICGYNSDLYNDMLTGWKQVSKTTAANGGLIRQHSRKRKKLWQLTGMNNEIFFTRPHIQIRFWRCHCCISSDACVDLCLPVLETIPVGKRMSASKFREAGFDV